jgi:hypothetical protein
MQRNIDIRVRRNFRYCRLGRWFVLLALLAAAPAARAATGDDDEYDSYKLRLDLSWVYSQPTGHFQSQSNFAVLGRSGTLDLDQDIGFNSYSTFLGKADWKFTHKNHLYFIATNFSQSKTVVLNRTITFQGKTYNVGATATGTLDSLFLSPGYQYDFIRRKRGSLGVQVQLNLVEITGTMAAASQVNNGVPQAASVSSGRLRAPLPVAGPIIRFYIIPNSSRLFVDANVLGMYFFGYGNYVSSYGMLGVTLTKNLSLRGGYTLGSRVDVKTKSDRLGMTLSQHGALAGLQVSF